MDNKEFLKGLYEALIRTQQNVPEGESLKEASDKGKYDYLGYIAALVAGDPTAKASINPGDGKLHYPDPWKHEDHPTHQWKTVEDYLTQAKYKQLTDEEMRNSFKALFSNSRVYQKALQLERETPDYGIGGEDSQRLLTNYIFRMARQGDSE